MTQLISVQVIIPAFRRRGQAGEQRQSLLQAEWARARRLIHCSAMAQAEELLSSFAQRQAER
jgi:hypothetical protein